MPSIQAPAAVVMVRPHRFAPNPETAADNAFQSLALTETAQAVASAAYREVTSAAERLEAEGVRVHLFEDRGEHNTPEAFIAVRAWSGARGRNRTGTPFGGGF